MCKYWSLLFFLLTGAPAGATELLAESFEGGVMPPIGWSTIDTNLTANWEIAGTPHSGIWAASVGPGAGTPSNEWLRSTTIDLTGVWDGVASFWAASDTTLCPAGSSGTTMLFHVTDPTYVAIATPWDMCIDENWPNIEYRLVSAQLGEFHDQTIRIAWRYVGSSGQIFGLDDVVVTGTPSGPVLLPGGPWPWYAHPAITVDPPIPAAGQPTQLCTRVVNLDGGSPHTVNLQLAWAGMTIGVPYAPMGGPIPVTASAGGEGLACLWWVPPFAGSFFIEARLITGYEDHVAWHNLDLDESLEPLVARETQFVVRNPRPTAATVSLGIIPHVTGWSFELYPDTIPNLPPGGEQGVVLTVTPPAQLPIPRTPVVDVEAYIADELIGGFRKVHYPPHLFADGFESADTSAWSATVP